MDGMDRPPALSAAGVIAEMQEEQSIPRVRKKKDHCRQCEGAVGKSLFRQERMERLSDISSFLCI